MSNRAFLLLTSLGLISATFIAGIETARATTLNINGSASSGDNNVGFSSSTSSSDFLSSTPDGGDGGGYAIMGAVRDDEVREGTVPLSLDEIRKMEPPKEDNFEKDGLPLEMRRDAIKEAAISFGARSGLAWRTYAIQKELAGRARYLDKVYDFRQLLVSAPSGLLIEPPIINEQINAMLIEGDGQQAAVSDRIYNIINNARIVSSPRTWRAYLERDWGAIEPPPTILLPKDEDERAIWHELVTKGWEEGVRQGDETFEADLSVLNADFEGMVRYRMLLAQGMVSPPYALQVDRGVTGGGDEMRIGDRAVQITGVPELITGSDQWQPANR